MTTPHGFETHLLTKASDRLRGLFGGAAAVGASGSGERQLFDAIRTAVQTASDDLARCQPVSIAPRNLPREAKAAREAAETMTSALRATVNAIAIGWSGTQRDVLADEVGALNIAMATLSLTVATHPTLEHERPASCREQTLDTLDRAVDAVSLAVRPNLTRQSLEPELWALNAADTIIRSINPTRGLGFGGTGASSHRVPRIDALARAYQTTKRAVRCGATVAAALLPGLAPDVVRHIIAGVPYDDLRVLDDLLCAPEHQAAAAAMAESLGISDVMHLSSRQVDVYVVALAAHHSARLSRFLNQLSATQRATLSQNTLGAILSSGHVLTPAQRTEYIMLAGLSNLPPGERRVALEDPRALPPTSENILRDPHGTRPLAPGDARLAKVVAEVLVAAAHDVEVLTTVLPYVARCDAHVQYIFANAHLFSHALREAFLVPATNAVYAQHLRQVSQWAHRDPEARVSADPWTRRITESAGVFAETLMRRETRKPHADAAAPVRRSR